MQLKLNEYLSRAGFGRMIAAAVPLSGGLMHRMYRVQTEKGIFALKLLNKEVMKRPEALHNMVMSEKIAHALQGKVPLVAAAETNGSCVHYFDEQYYMVYPWLEGRSIFPPEIRENHCAKMGEVLANIHEAGISVDGVEKTAFVREEKEWETVLSVCQQEAWASEIKKLLPEIENWQKSGCLAAEKLSGFQVISHRDLDPKNVMWQKDAAVLIDWEAAGYINPWQEAVECLFYWADDGRGSLNKSLFQAFLGAYAKGRSLSGAPWEEALSCGYLGMIDWLYYNARRAAGFEDINETELGREQVFSTLETLKNRGKANEQMLAWLTNRI